MAGDESYAKSLKHSGSVLSATEKVLGVHWNKEEDQLVLDLKEVQEDSSLDVLSPTKRDVARITSMTYDPMGFIIPDCQNEAILPKFMREEDGVG